MNEQYKQALKKGIAFSSTANGEEFMKRYKAMTADLCHRKKQKVTVKGIFRDKEVTA